jgi:hypothetical protein
MTNIPEPSPGQPDPSPGQSDPPDRVTQQIAQAGSEGATIDDPPAPQNPRRKPRALTRDALIKKIKKALDDGGYSCEAFIHTNAEKLGDFTPEAVREIWDSEVKDRLVDNAVEEQTHQLFSYPFQFTHPLRTPETTPAQFLLVLKEKCTASELCQELTKLLRTLHDQEDAYKTIINKPLDSSGRLDCTPEELQRAVKEMAGIDISKRLELMRLNESNHLGTRKLMRLLPSQASSVALSLELVLHGLNKLESQLKDLEPPRKSSDPIEHGPPPPSVQLHWIRQDLESIIEILNTLTPKHQTELPGKTSAQPAPPPLPKEKRARQKRQTPEPLAAVIRKWMELTREGFDEFPKWTEGMGSALQSEREELEKELQVIKDRELQEKRLYGKSFLSSKEKADQWRGTERLKRVKLLCRIDELAPTPDALKAAFAETARLCEEERQEQLKMGKRPIGSNQPPLSAEELAVVRAAAEAKQAAAAKEREQDRAAEFEAQKAQQAARVAAQKARRAEREARLREDLLSGKIDDPYMAKVWLTPEERVRAHQARMARREEKNLQKEKPSD